MTEDRNRYTALITGGSSGLGFEMAKQLLKDGAAVIIAARGKERLEEAKKALSEFGDVYAVEMDVKSEESVKTAAGWIEEHFEHLDMVVSNAGIGRNAPGYENLERNHRFYEIPVSIVRDVAETNFIGTFIVARCFVPQMLKHGHGSFVYVSTSDSTMVREGQIPYGPSKAGAEALTAVMDKELYASGILVNVITPGGFTDTNMAGRGDAQERRKKNLPVLPPTVLNKTISFLASPASKGIHGEKIIGKDFDEWLAAKELHPVN